MHQVTEDGGTALLQSAPQAGAAKADAVDSASKSARRKPQPSAQATLLTAAQAAREIFGIGERTFLELRDEEWMPLPVVLGPRLLRWHRQELVEAAQRMPRAKRASPEPAHLRRARPVAA